MNELSNREKDVLNELYHSHSFKVVAQNMFLSIETIRTHKKNIYRKLDINNAIQLGRWLERCLPFGDQ